MKKRLALLSSLLFVSFLTKTCIDFLFHSKSTNFENFAFGATKWDETRWLNISPLQSPHTSQGFVFKSSHRCVGNLEYPQSNAKRACVFKNICYRKDSKTFLYFKSPSSKVKDFGIPDLVTISPDYKGISLEITNQIPDSFAHVDGTFLMRKGFSEFGYFGHDIWDLLFGYFTNMKMLGIERSPSLHFIFLWLNSKLQSHGILSEFLSKHPIASLDGVLNFSQDSVCFNHFAVAAGSDVATLSFRLRRPNLPKPVNYLRSSLYNDIRGIVFEHFNIIPDIRQPSPTIVIVKKSSSVHSKYPVRSISNIDEVAEALQQRFSHIPVQVVSLSNYTLESQLHILQNTTILITPPGGIACILPFMPKDSDVILFDVKIYDGIENYKANASASIDTDVWDAFPHVAKHYYQIFNESDFIWANNRYRRLKYARDGMIYVANIDRLSRLVDRVIGKRDLALNKF